LNDGEVRLRWHVFLFRISGGSDYGSLLYAGVCWRMSGYMAGCDWLDQMGPSYVRIFDWSFWKEMEAGWRERFGMQCFDKGFEAGGWVGTEQGGY
jgi:hypothetical protein